MAGITLREKDKGARYRLAVASDLTGEYEKVRIIKSAFQNFKSYYMIDFFIR